MGLIWLMFGGCNQNTVEKSMKKGTRAISNAEWANAAGAFQQAINLDPDPLTAAQAQNYLGLAQWKLGNVDFALKAFQQSSRLAPSLFEPEYNHGQILMEQGFLHNAAQNFETAADISPHDARPLEMLAQIALRQDDVNTAQKRYRQAIKRSPSEARLPTALALTYLRDQRPLEAEVALKSALALDNTYAPALFNLGQLYETQGREEDALTYYKRHREIETSDSWKDHSRAALARLGGNKEEDAKAALASSRAAQADEAVEAPLDGSAPTASGTDRKTSLLDLANQAAADGKFQSAVGICLQASMQARREGDKEGEHRALRAATRFAPDSASAHFALGRFLASEGRQREAIGYYDRATLLQPGYAAALVGKADCAIEDYDYNVALKALRQAASTDPKNADILWKLTELRHNHIKMNASTRESLELFIQRFPKDPRIRTAREWLAQLPSTRKPAPLRMRINAAPRGPEQTKPKVAPLRHETLSLKPVVSGVEENNMVGLARFSSDEVLTPRPEPSPLEKAEALLKQGDADEAVRILENYLVDNPAATKVYLRLAQLYKAEGRTNVQQTMYYRALRNDPDNIEARFLLGMLHLEAGRYREAFTQLADVAERDDSNHEAAYQLGEMSRTVYRDNVSAARYYRLFLERTSNQSDPRRTTITEWLNRNG